MDACEDLIQQVWEKAREVENFDPALYRKDPCGAWIFRKKYANTDSVFGWEIDHVVPKSTLRGMGVKEKDIDDMLNLRPMNWMNNRSKSNDYPEYLAVVRAEGKKNIKCEVDYCVNDELCAMLEKKFGKISQ